MNGFSAQLALSPVTRHCFGCTKGTAKSTAGGDPLRNGLSLPGVATARHGRGLWLGAMGESTLRLLSSSLVVVTLRAKTIAM